MKSVYLILAVILLSSCSSVRLRHEALVKNKQGQHKKYVYEKSYSTGSLPLYCGITGIFYGGYCWKYRYLPDVEMKHKLLTDSYQVLAKVIDLKSSKIYDENVIRLSFDNYPSSTLIGNAGVSEDSNMLERSKVEVANERTLNLNYRLSLVVRSNGTGLSLHKILSKKFTFGLVYFKQGHGSGRAKYGDIIKSADDIGIDFIGFIKDRTDKTGLYLKLRPVYSSRVPETTSKCTTCNFDTSKKKYFFDSFIGVQYVFHKVYNINLSLGHTFELGPDDSHRTNNNVLEADFGYAF